MSGLTRYIYLEDVALIDRENPDRIYTVSDLDQIDLGTQYTDRYWLLFNIPDSDVSYLMFKSLLSAQIRLPFFCISSGYRPYLRTYACDKYTLPVTWTSRPDTSPDRVDSSSLKRMNGGFDFADDWLIPETVGDVSSYTKRDALNYLKSGAIAVNIDGTSLAEYQGLAIGAFHYATEAAQEGHTIRKPRLDIEYDSSVLIRPTLTVYNSPSGTDAYTDPTKPITFEWTLDSPHISDVYYYGEFNQLSAALLWKLAGDETYTRVNVSGHSFVTLPANYFPRGRITWYVECILEDGKGTLTTTPTSFSTTDTWIRATPQFPVSEIVETGQDMTVTWTHYNPYGNPQTAADLQYRQSGGSWTDLGSVEGDVHAFTVPDGRLPAGSYQWRVRSYNLESEPGEWSAEASFILLGAPAAPSVTTDAKPYATISWQTVDQQAYRISVDGQDLGIKFGETLSYKLSEPLSDGWHTASVSVQGSFGLWSPPGTVEFIVENVPGAEVELIADFGIDARLFIVQPSEALDLRIYRDDQQIGKTYDQIFTDRFALGEHSYYVLNVLPDGYYTKSNVVVGTMKTCTTVIDTVQDPAGWMELRLTDRDPDEQIFSWQRTASLRHFTGSAYPVLEFSKYEDGSGTYNVAFKDLEAARAFEALKGKVVIIKSRGDNVVIGALLQLQKRVGHFYSAYDFTVQRIAWEDYIDDQDS